MTNSKFSHVKITGIKTVVPEKILSVDDELQFYKNNQKLLERNKKILGVGKRHIVEEGMTCLDLCEDAAKKLFKEMNVEKDDIDTILFVSICHDYNAPASSCILQGRLGLSEECNCIDTHGISCSGYVHGLWLAHSLIASGASRKILLLTGDTNSMHSDVRNRISNMLYGDAGSATILEYSDKSDTAYFYLGARGENWDKIIAPATGHRLPVRKDIADIEITDANGNVWHLWEDILKGMDVFKFTMECAPKSIKTLLKYSGKTDSDIDFYAMHQANGQIVKTIAQHAEISKEKISSETFSKYANCGAASVVTNICDKLSDKSVSTTMFVTFGTGLSWGSCIVDLKNTYIGKIDIFKPEKTIPTRTEMIQHWIKEFKGE